MYIVWHDLQLTPCSTTAQSHRTARGHVAAAQPRDVAGTLDPSEIPQQLHCVCVSSPAMGRELRARSHSTFAQSTYRLIV